MKNARLNILSKDDMDKIHATTLQVMQNPGILIKHDKARELCKKAGCDVDDNTMIVKFPPELVEECLKKCPKTVNLYSRNGKVWQQAGDVEVDVFASLRRGHYKPGLINAGRGASDAAFRKFMMSRK